MRKSSKLILTISLKTGIGSLEIFLKSSLSHPIFYRYFDKYIVLVLDNGICICYHKDMVPIPYTYAMEGASI